MEKVCILLSTYNGEKYVNEQIDSLLAQENVDVTLLVRDDGSKDNTVSILREYAEKFPNVVILEKEFGNNFNVAKSFAFLLTSACKMFSDINYFFFADQDDFWLSDKCFRAVDKLKVHSSKPALYFSKKKLVNGKLDPLDKDDVIRLTGSFWDYFDRSNAYGCTMCMTRPLVHLLEKDYFYKHPFLHDNYIYRLCLAGSLPIVYDNTETILYRQHGNNVAGSVKRNVFRGLKKLFKKDRVHIIREMSKYILEEHSEIVSKSSRRILKLLIASQGSARAKFKLIKLYIKQKNRSFKEKVMFSIMILTNYF